MLKLVVVIVLSFPHLLWAISTLDPKKSTVCSITLNSDNEREIFKREIQKDPKAYNPLVELTDFGGSDWFDKACASGIKCDQLLISGHFTDGFGGTSHGVRRSLSLKKMEKAGCMKTCSGILDHPYEVYLLGCNTVATKAPDNRAPDVYLKHLIEDGVSEKRAQIITETRYGTMGDDNRSSIARAFRGQEKILYGFTARGPSGATIEPMLNEYFKKTTLKANLNKAENLRLTGSINSFNKLLSDSLSATAFDQCEAGADDAKDRRICKMIHPNISVDNKLAVIEDAFTDDNWPKYIPAINQFFREHPTQNFTEKQKNLLKNLSQNRIIERQSVNLMTSSKYQAVKDEWAFFIKSMGFKNGSPSSPARSNDVIGDIIKGL